MRIAKIIGGIILLWASLKEYLHASREVSDFFDFGIILGVLAMLFICAWLIGSGISGNRLDVRSLKFWGYYGLTLLPFLAIIIILLIPSQPTELIKANGLTINISPYMESKEQVFVDETERREYCQCTARKLAENDEIATTYADELEEGQIDAVIDKIKSDPGIYASLNLGSCQPQKQQQ